VEIFLRVCGSGPGASTELLDGGASDVLFFDRLCTTIDGGDERSVRDPESGPQIASGARPVELREHLDRGGRKGGVARGIDGELGAAIEDAPELAADDGRYREQSLERSVFAPGSLECLHVEVFVVDGDDQAGM
jgi:hypothetical protein